MLLLSHLFRFSSTPQLLTEGGSRPGSLVLFLFSIYAHSLDGFIQSNGFKHRLYADDPSLDLSLNSSLIYPTVNSTFPLGYLLAPHTSHTHSQGRLTGVPPGQLHRPHSQKGPRLGLMLYCHHFETFNNFFKQRATHFPLALAPHIM